jgi:hypothetical protein
VTSVKNTYARKISNDLSSGAFFILASTLALYGQTAKPIDVCALFADPVAFNGLMIRVRGTILTGAGEGGPWLSGEHCRSRISVKNHEFPNIIELADPEDKIQRLHPVDFVWDEASLQQFESMLRRLNRKTEHLRVTVIGVFETRTPLSDLVQEKRPFPDNGFGHMNGSPAQILVKTMLDIQVEQNR